MKILLPVIGVRGDVQIFLALAQALKNSGHEVLVCTKEYFRGLCVQYNIPFSPLAGDGDNGSKQLQAVMEARSVLEGAKIGLDFFLEVLHEQTEILQKVIPQFDIVVGYGSFGQAEAEIAGKPFYSVVIDPSMAEKQFTFNPLLNMSLLMERMALHFLLGKEYAKFRKKINAPLKSAKDYPCKVFLPMSSAVVPPARNWSDKNELSGFWFINGTDTYEPSQELQTFLESGRKPLFITFGSAGWSESDTGEVVSLVRDALEKAGERGIMLVQQEFDRSLLSDNLLVVNEIPYNWLLKRVSAVVHHCGMGTTAEVLRAGVPAIPVPFMIDQFQWAKRIYKAGAATKPIDRRKLTVDTLSSAIKEVVSKESLREKAGEISNVLNAEDGLKRVVEIIEFGLIR